MSDPDSSSPRSRTLRKSYTQIMLNIVVTVGPQRLAEVAEVAEELRGRGMVVERVLESTGLITGTVPDNLRDGLGSVPGVASVDTERSYQLPPPDADIQ